MGTLTATFLQRLDVCVPRGVKNFYVFRSTVESLLLLSGKGLQLQLLAGRPSLVTAVETVTGKQRSIGGDTVVVTLVKASAAEE